jgi:hypothetical protein
MLSRVLSAAAILFAVTAGAARATPLEDAEAAYANGDYVAAFERLSSLALQGSGDAEYKLGCLYQNGQGVPRNLDEAVTWFLAAANHDMTAAAATLGLLYSLGLGVPKDADLSADWFSRAAQQSTDTAMMLPGDLPHD